MKSFFLMVSFFTRLPVPGVEYTEERFGKAMRLLPLVGLLAGVILVLAQVLLLALHASGLLRGAALVCVYIFLTGGLHFDGLADTCDGVFSGRSREQSLGIMKDSRIGVFGTLGILMAGLLYFACFIIASAPALLAFPICGRACCLISASLAPYAREEGMGKAVSVGGGPLSVVSAIISLVAGAALSALLEGLIIRLGATFGALYEISLTSGGFYRIGATAGAFSGICVLIASVLAVLIAIAMTAHFKKKLGGVTGDTYGAVIETSSIVFLFACAILPGVLPI